MMLIAKKPCAFCGHSFFIGEEIPYELVSDPELQERYGVLTVVKDEVATDEIMVPVVIEDDGEAAQMMGVPLSAGDIQYVFSIMQMNVSEAEKEINGITTENVLIVLNACDTRSGVRKAAKKRADYLFPEKEDTNEACNGIEFVDDDTE